MSSISTAVFLGKAGPDEGRPGRAAVTVILCAAAAIGAAVAVALCVVLTAGALMSREAGGLQAAMDLLSNANRPDRSPGSYVYELALAGLSSFAAALALLAVAARRAGRPMRSFLTTASHFRWRHALVGLAVFLPVVMLEIGVETLGSPQGPPSPLFVADAALAGRLAYAGAAVAFLWMAALAEEIIFRGWLLQQTGAFTRNLALVLAVNAIVFSLAHGDPSPGAFLARCALGAGWAWIVLQLGGIEFAAGAHFANNLGIALLVRPVILAAPKPEPFDLVSVALQMGTVAALAAGVTWWTRRARAPTRTVT